MRRRRRRIAFLASLCAAALLFILYWPVNRAACLAVHPSGEMMDRNGRQLYAFMNGRQQWCFERRLDEISPRLIQATLLAEDRHFYWHPGVDPLAAVRAAAQNILHRRVVSGASTLTMQVVKRAYGPAGSLWGKVLQAWAALRLERRATKNEILQTYLNTAPYGLNLIGCEAAARRYFGKPASELTLAEAALLSALPKSPTTLMPLGHPQEALVRRDAILARMHAAGLIDETQYRAATAETTRAEWHAFAQLSPHLAMRWKSRIAAEGRLDTSLDARVQERAEDLLRRHLATMTGQVGNAAMIVIDTANAAVLAHVGAGDFYDKLHAGQVDATRSPRSPGSALKPFTYALAMEHGRLYPGEMLLDDTADYGLYNPENMDRRYRGLVSAGVALQRSLNVPAVTVLDRIGAPALHGFLRSLDLRTLRRPAEYYGLGLTLGSCDVRLEELAGAYTMLAGLGRARPLGWSWPPPARPERQALARGTCLKIYEMLEQALPRELQEDPAAATVSLSPRVCWKTGTSWGHHDAWAFVFNQHYVVGVWAGNHDGNPSSYLMGARAALPLAGRMMRALKPGEGPAWPNPAGELRQATVCALSGLPASPWCRQTRPEWLPRTQLLNRVCDMHYPADSPLDAPAQAVSVLERWPGSARTWDLAHITEVFAPANAREARSESLFIRTPGDKAEYILTGAPEGDRIRLATSLDGQCKIYWYLDEKFIGLSEPWKPLMLELAPGSHSLVCMTPGGLTAKTNFEVLIPEALERPEAWGSGHKMH